MGQEENWLSLGQVDDLKSELGSTGNLKEVRLQEQSVLLTLHKDSFGAIDNRCNHMGAPLSQGRLRDGRIECPWHYWQFNHQTGKGEDSSSHPLASCAGHVSSYSLKVNNGELFIDTASKTERLKPSYNPALHLAREPIREPGKLRVLGLSTSAIDKDHPRYSTSEDVLRKALTKAEAALNVESKIISLSDLTFRPCEGFYSKSEKACTWPCSITKMDPKDELIHVYEAVVHWADVVIVATPIRWGAASSLYYKMAERFNSIQNQITIRDRVLIKNKVAGFIITGGQDNIQAVAGQMLTFFGELGFVTPPFPFVGHSLGWSAENMQKNVDFVKNSVELHEHAFELVSRTVDSAKLFHNR